MGNSQLYGFDPTLSSKQIDTQSQYKIYQSSNGQQYQKYSVLHDGSSNFEQNYQFRLENKHKDLVEVLYAAPIQTMMGCADRNSYEVVTERITYRLNDLSFLQTNNAFVILVTSLRGFRDLFRKHGPFAIAWNMIGLNTKDKVKIWLNSNFSLNKPEPLQIQLPPSEAQAEMVSSIFSLINEKTEKNPLWREIMMMNNKNTFDQSILSIDAFLGDKGIVVRDKVINIFNKSYYQNDQQGKLVEAGNDNYDNSRVEHFNGSLESLKVKSKPFEGIQQSFIEKPSKVYNHILFNRPAQISRNNSVGTIFTNNQPHTIQSQNIPIPQPQQHPIIIDQSRHVSNIPLSHQQPQPVIDQSRHPAHLIKSKQSNFIQQQTVVLQPPKPFQIIFNKNNVESSVPIFSGIQNKNHVLHETNRIKVNNPPQSSIAFMTKIQDKNSNIKDIMFSPRQQVVSDKSKQDEIHTFSLIPIAVPNSIPNSNSSSVVYQTQPQQISLNLQQKKSPSVTQNKVIEKAQQTIVNKLKSTNAIQIKQANTDKAQQVSVVKTQQINTVQQQKNPVENIQQSKLVNTQQPVISINLHDVQSEQQSIHEQLNPLLEKSLPKPAIKIITIQQQQKPQQQIQSKSQSSLQKIFHKYSRNNLEQHTQKNLSSFKLQINKNEKQKLTQSTNKKSNLSYKEMRRLLLEQLED